MIEIIAPYIGMGLLLTFILFMLAVVKAQEKDRRNHTRQNKR